MNKFVDAIRTDTTESMLSVARDRYGRDLSASAGKKLERKINTNAEIELHKAYSNFQIIRNVIDSEKEKKMNASHSNQERAAIEEEYEGKWAQNIAEFKNVLNTTIDSIRIGAGEEIVTCVLSNQQQQKKKTIEACVRDHLRGFSRTIPSFLMAYGSEGEITLADFDRIIPGDVFEEVTSITLEQFRFLRDGGEYIDEDTGKREFYEGHLFDPVVFDDSVKEFMALRKRLANYFDDDAVGDIFDYIPPQKTNQIFTPKNIVKDMVDMLERENPGCFDDETKTFADLYMKSGMYIAEIVKRLYRSGHLKALYPDERVRLNHIFSEQVYGLAPTEIIYRIVLSFLLGFDDTMSIPKHNIRLCDSLELAKDGTTEQDLRSIFSL